MTTAKPIGSPGASRAYEPRSTAEKIGQDASLAGLAAAAALQAVEVAAIVLLGLLVCPPPAIFVVVVVPLVVTALALGLTAAVLSAPYPLVHHFRGHGRRPASLLAHRVRRAGGAPIDLLPDRVVTDARKLDRAKGHP